MAELNSVLKLIEGTSVPFVITDGQRRVIASNEPFSEMSGQAQDDILGELLASFLIGEKSSQREVARISERLNEGTPFDFSIEAYRKSGETFFLGAFVIPFVDGKDSIPYVIFILREKVELDQPLLADAPLEFKKLIGVVLELVQAS